MPFCPKHFVHIHSLNPLPIIVKWVILSPLFYRWGNQGTEKLSDLQNLTASVLLWVGCPRKWAVVWRFAHTRCQGALPGLFPEGREGSRAGQKSGYDAVPAEALVTPGGSDGKASARNAGDLGSIPGSGRSPGDGYGNPLQYSCLENSMDRGTL